MGGRFALAPPFLPAFFCILFFIILVYFRKYFDTNLKNIVENECFGYEVAMKGGYERLLFDSSGSCRFLARSQGDSHGKIREI